MRHLLSHSVYQGLEQFGDDPWRAMGDIGCDGLELLTAYSPVDPMYREYTETVHIPYATDWLAAWEGRPYDMDDETSLYVMYGRDRGSVISNLSSAIEHAASLSPAHGVLHATNIDLPEVFKHGYSRDSKYVLGEFCELVNTVVGAMPGAEPPFRLLFENLWWPGLRLVDESDFRYLDRHIEFEGWGICLDTGHLMNCLPGIDTEADGIEALRDIFQGYSRDLVDSVLSVHFHHSASGAYRASFEERDMDCDPSEFYRLAYPHIASIDQHLPFSDPACAELIDILSPNYVVHEMPGTESGPLEDFRQQRGLLP